MRNLYILRSGEYLPLLLSLPPTSLKPFNEFMNTAFITRRRPTWSAIVQISLKRVDNGSSPYSIASFRKVANITGEQLAQVKQYADSFREQVRLMNQQRAALTESMSDTTVYDLEMTTRPQKAAAILLSPTMLSTVNAEICRCKSRLHRAGKTQRDIAGDTAVSLFCFQEEYDDKAIEH